VITELRIYSIKRGHMAAWLERWAETAEKNVELGIRIEFAGVDPENQGTFIWARSFADEAERQRLSEVLYGSDWWQAEGDDVMSHVVTYEVRLLRTAFEHDEVRGFVSVWDPGG
jgi:hypothetical protein